MSDIIYLPAWMHIIICIYDNPDITSSEVHRKTVFTYSHVTHVCQELSFLGLIKATTTGRMKMLNVTIKGETLCKLIGQVVKGKLISV